MNINTTGAVNQLKSLIPDKLEFPRDGKVEQRSMSSVSLQVSEFNIELFDTSNTTFSAQSGLAHLINNPDFDVANLTYNGRSILDLSPSEAADLVSEEGYYGVKKTAGRLSGFVINGGGDDLEKVKAGREGIARGFKEAEKLWGGTLPEISYKTLELALQQIDTRIQELGGSVINTEV